MPAIPALPQPLQDGRVSIRLAAERDIPEILIAYQDDPQMHLRLGEAKPPSGAQLGARSERADSDLAAGRLVRLTILVDGRDDCRGQVTVHSIDWEHRRAEVGIWIAPAFRNGGIAAASLRLSARWLFDVCGLQRLTILTEPANEAMLASAQAAGYAYEGVLRAYTLERGARVDCAVLSLLPSDLE
jgi:RimJ/RimL family protein N-acetyltransferase